MDRRLAKIRPMRKKPSALPVTAASRCRRIASRALRLRPTPPLSSPSPCSSAATARGASSSGVCRHRRRGDAGEEQVAEAAGAGFHAPRLTYFTALKRFRWGHSLGIRFFTPSKCRCPVPCFAWIPGETNNNLVFDQCLADIFIRLRPRCIHVNRHFRSCRPRFCARNYYSMPTITIDRYDLALLDAVQHHGNATDAVWGPPCICRPRRSAAASSASPRPAVRRRPCRAA